MDRSPDVADAIVLDERLCLALYTVSRAMTARYRPALSALGLTYPQYLVMVLLWEEGAATVGQVGTRLGLESSTLSPLLKRLEAMGLIRRTRGSRDERSVTVALTDEGRGLEQRAAGVPAAICAATGLPVSEQAALVAQLRELTGRLHASTARATSPSL